MTIAKYQTDLSDSQWKIIEPMLPKPKPKGRPQQDRRQVINAIFYIAKGGIPWRMLPCGFPPWQTVYHIFRQWAADNTWERIQSCLRTQVREKEGKRSRPTAAILDSQSVKSDSHGGEVGYDGGKKIKGRKRHILVDTMGLLLAVVVTPASTPERDGAQVLLSQYLNVFNWLRVIWVDSGYSGPAFAQWVSSLKQKLKIEVVKRPDSDAGFKVVPKRWIVERTFGWLMRHRRLVRDYDKTESSAEAWIHVAMIRIQLNRLA